MIDREHSMTSEEVDVVENRLRHLSLALLPQLIERDLPRLINEVRSLHAILFMNQFQNSLHKGVVDETGTEADSVQGTDQEGTGDSQGGEGDRAGGGDVASFSDKSVPDPAGTRQPSRVHSGRAANKKRNRKRRRRNK
jgi:hypothetical protein